MSNTENNQVDEKIKSLSENISNDVSEKMNQQFDAQKQINLEIAENIKSMTSVMSSLVESQKNNSEVIKDISVKSRKLPKIEGEEVSNVMQDSHTTFVKSFADAIKSGQSTKFDSNETLYNMMYGRQKKSLHNYIKSIGNTFSNDSYNYLFQAPRYDGVIDLVQLSSAPIVSLSEQVMTSSVSNVSLGIDKTKIVAGFDADPLNNVIVQELMAAQTLQNFRQSLLTTDMLGIFVKYDLSNKIVDFQDQSYLSIMSEMAVYFEEYLLKWKNDIAMLSILKSPLNGGVPYLTKTANILSLDDIILASAILKRTYRQSPSFTLLINANAAAGMKTEVGNNGQYKWIPVLDNMMSVLVGMDTKINVVVVDNDSIGLDEYNTNETGNTGKTVAILADLSSLGRQYNSTKNIYDTNRSTELNGYQTAFHRTYTGYMVKTMEAGIKIKIS